MNQRKDDCNCNVKEPEISTAGQNAAKRWNRINWLMRIGVAVVILAILVVSFGPYCVYRYGQHQLDRGNISEALSTFEGLYRHSSRFGTFRIPRRAYKDSGDKMHECHYRLGLELMEEGDYEEAIEEFILSRNYGDSQALIVECNSLLGTD